MCRRQALTLSDDTIVMLREQKWQRNLIAHRRLTEGEDENVTVREKW